mgnify:CR=1 FL=1
MSNYLYNFCQNDQEDLHFLDTKNVNKFTDFPQRIFRKRCPVAAGRD